MEDELVLDVNFDIKKAEAKMKTLNAEYEKQKAKVQKIKDTISDTESTIEKQSAAFEKSSAEAQKLAKQLLEAKSIADKIGSEQGRAMTMIKNGIASYPTEYSRAEKKVEDLETKFNNARNKAAELRAEIKKLSPTLQNERLEYDIQNAKLEEKGVKILELQTKQKSITEEAQKETAAHEQSEAEMEKTATATEEVRKGVEDTIEEAERLQSTTKNVSNGFTKFANRLKELVKQAFIFTVISQALRKLKQQFSDFIKQDPVLNSMMTELKTNLRIIGQIFVETIKPVLQWILEKLVFITDTIVSALAKLIGKSVKEMKALAKATKEATKAFAGFDTIQIIDTSGDGSGGESMVNTVKNTLENIYAMLAIGAGLIVLGAILAFSGVNIPIGITLMALGAVMIYSVLSENWDKLPKKVKEVIGVIMVIGGTLLFVVGIILAFSGINIILGILMIIGGLFLLGQTDNGEWSDAELVQDVKNTVNTLMTIVGVAMIVIGIIMCCCGFVPAGLAVIVAGGLALALGTESLDWKWIEDMFGTIGEWCDKIGKAFSDLWEGVSEEFKEFGERMNEDCDKISKGWNEIMEGNIESGAENILFGVADLIVDIVNGIIRVLYWIAGAVDWVLGSIFGNDTLKQLGEDAMAGKNMLTIPRPSDFDKSLKEKESLRVITEAANLASNKSTNDLFAKTRSLSSAQKTTDKDVEEYLRKMGYNIPKYATGAVIPGGSPFLAMLGDQRRGQTNVEAPLDTIVEAFRAVQPEQKFTIEATGSMSQLIKLLNLEIKKEDRRSSIKAVKV